MYRAGRITTLPVDSLNKSQITSTRKYYPSSEQNRRDAVQQKVPFARIRLLDAVAAKQKAPFAAVWREAGASILIKQVIVYLSFFLSFSLFVYGRPNRKA